MGELSGAGRDLGFVYSGQRQMPVEGAGQGPGTAGCALCAHPAPARVFALPGSGPQPAGGAGHRVPDEPGRPEGRSGAHGCGGRSDSRVGGAGSGPEFRGGDRGKRRGLFFQAEGEGTVHSFCRELPVFRKNRPADRIRADPCGGLHLLRDGGAVLQPGACRCRDHCLQGCLSGRCRGHGHRQQDSIGAGL